MPQKLNAFLPSRKRLFFAFALFAIGFFVFGPVEIKGQTPVLTVSDDALGLFQISSIEWGKLSAGSDASHIIYVRNNGETPLTSLSVSAVDWFPSNAEAFLSLVGYPDKAMVNPGEIVRVPLSLSVSNSVVGVSDFSFGSKISYIIEDASSPTPIKTPSPTLAPTSTATVYPTASPNPIIQTPSPSAPAPTVFNPFPSVSPSPSQSGGGGGGGGNGGSIVLPSSSPGSGGVQSNRFNLNLFGVVLVGAAVYILFSGKRRR